MNANNPALAALRRAVARGKPIDWNVIAPTPRPLSDGVRLWIDLRTHTANALGVDFADEEVDGPVRVTLAVLCAMPRADRDALIARGMDAVHEHVEAALDAGFVGGM